METTRKFRIKLGIYFLFFSSILLGIALNNPSITIFNDDLQQYEPFDFFGTRFAVSTDENTDGDSNKDGVANVGVTNSTYSDAQSLNGQYQGFWEDEVGGGIANDTDYLYNNTDDNYSPTDVGTYSDATKMNANDNDYNTLTEVLSGYAGFNTTQDVDSNTTDVDSNQDNGVETNFANAQGTTLDSTYMNIQETNSTTGEGFLLKPRYSIKDITNPDSGFVWRYGAGEGYGYNSITTGISTVYDSTHNVWLNNDTLKAQLLNCTYETAYDGFDLACYHGIYADYDIYFYPQNVTIRNGADGIAMRPNQLRYYDITTGDSQTWQTATQVDPFYSTNPFKRVYYEGVYPLTTYNYYYDRGSIKEIINMSAAFNQYPANPPYGIDNTYVIHVQDIIMKGAYTWYDDDGVITDTKFNLTGDLRLGNAGKLLGVFPTGIVWSSISGQHVEDQIVASLVRISDTQWQLGSAIPYSYLRNNQRDSPVFIDPTWTVGLTEANWLNSTTFDIPNIFYNSTSNAMQLNSSWDAGFIFSKIEVAPAHWSRIRIYSNSLGKILMFFNSSRNPIQDPYQTDVVTWDAQSSVIYNLPSPQQEKYGAWILLLQKIGSEIPEIYNVTLFNDNQVTYYDPTGTVSEAWNDGTGSSPYYTEIDDGDRAPDTPASLADYIQENSDGAVAEYTIDSVTEPNIVEVNFWAYVSTSARKTIDLDCEENGVEVCTTTTVPASITQTWYSANWTVSGGTVTDPLSLKFQCDKTAGGAPTDCIAYNAYLAVIWTPPSNPYIIDFEYQWTLAAGSWSNETFYLAIFSQNNPSTENLLVYYWTSGSTWSSLGTISSNGWFNVSLVSATFTSPNFYIRFVGSNETANDNVQDDWDIDLMIIHTGQEDTRVNRFDREVAFLNVTQATGGYNETLSWSSQLLSNPSFETADFTSWTTHLSGCGGVVNSGSAYDGTYKASFNCVSSGTFSQKNQTIDVSSYATQIDDGVAYYNLTGFGLRSTGDGSATFEVSEEDAFGSEIASRSNWTDSTTWENAGWLLDPIASGTRQLTVQIRWGLNIVSSIGFLDQIQLWIGYNLSSGIDSSYNYSNAELVVNTGSLDVDEVISVHQYNETTSSWVFITNLTSADSWTNISLINNVTQNMYFRFVDTNQTTVVDLDTDTWQIDYFALHLWNGTGSVYRFNWEHNASSLPTGGDNYYRLTIYGNASEDMDLYLWNHTAADWNDTAIGTISSTLQWYNFTITGNGLTGDNITWNYRDTITSSDAINSTMAIDYAGIYVWSLSLTTNQDPINVTAIIFSSDEQFNQFPMNITTDAGQNFNIDIKCTDVNASACSNGWIYVDSDSNPSGYTQLTTSYTTIYSDQTASTTLLNFWFWVNVPAGQTKQTHEINIWFRITNA